MLFDYVLFGVITTLVNIISYTFLTQFLYADFKIATTIAWIISVLFAFFTNKYYVFHSRNSKNIYLLSKEIGYFFFSRILSYGLDLISMIVLIELLRFDDLIAKIIANGLVILFNYFASKYFIFKQHEESDPIDD